MKYICILIILGLSFCFYIIKINNRSPYLERIASSVSTLVGLSKVNINELEDYRTSYFSKSSGCSAICIVNSRDKFDLDLSDFKSCDSTKFLTEEKCPTKGNWRGGFVIYPSESLARFNIPGDRTQLLSKYNPDFEYIKGDEGYYIKPGLFIYKNGKLIQSGWLYDNPKAFTSD